MRLVFQPGAPYMFGLTTQALISTDVFFYGMGKFLSQGWRRRLIRLKSRARVPLIPHIFFE